jgi:hypothetical protein
MAFCDIPEKCTKKQRNLHIVFGTEMCFTSGKCMCQSRMIGLVFILIRLLHRKELNLMKRKLCFSVKKKELMLVTMK